MSGKTTVFYAGMVHEQFDELVTPHKVYLSVMTNAELFNGCVIHKNDEWFNGDLTPISDNDVPKGLRMLLLLLN